jgi:hypothetical protein
VQITKLIALTPNPLSQLWERGEETSEINITANQIFKSNIYQIM